MKQMNKKNKLKLDSGLYIDELQHNDLICPLILTNINYTNINNKLPDTFHTDIKYSMLGRGRFSYVFLIKNTNTAIKISKILEHINDEWVKIRYNDENMMFFINEYINEQAQMVKYSKLKKIFPLNFIRIKKIKNIIFIGDILPSRIIKMEYINGVSLTTFLNKVDNVDNYYNVISSILLILIYANTNGYFHNDINMGNILISELKNNPISTTQLKYSVKIGNIPVHLDFSNYYPVFIDYSFSKIINNKNKFPIEAFIIFEKIKTHNTNYHTFPLFENVMNIFTIIKHKYSISELDLIKNLLFGASVFSISDYKNLPEITNNDLDKIVNALSKNNKFLLNAL